MKLRDLFEDGRIVKGVNTTVDVGPNEIKTQTAKFGNTVDKDGVPLTLSKKVKGKSTNVLFNLGLTEGYQLKLERDEEIDVLHIMDTKTKKRIEVRGKKGYETNGYDPQDKLHQVLDKVGRSANISELMNGKVVGINPKHPQGADAEKTAKDVLTTEALDNPYPFNLRGPDSSHNFAATAETPNGVLRMDFEAIDYDDFGIDFAVGKSMGKTEAGDEFRVFATVVAMMNKWISTVGIESVESFDFGANKGEHASDGRAKLYARFAKKLADQLGWKLEQSTTANRSTEFFKLTNPKPVPRDDDHWDDLEDNPGLEESLNLAEAIGEIASATEIYVDMDGVLADFFGEWAKLMQVDHFTDIDKQHDINDALQKIRDTDDFWLRLPILPEAKNLLNLIKQVKGEYSICTSPLADDPNSEKHKRTWVEKNLAFFPPKEVFVTHNKPQFATAKDGTPNILIDDYGVNINAWEAAGGIGFKYKDHKFERTAKDIKQHIDAPVEENFADGKKKGKK